MNRGLATLWFLIASAWSFACCGASPSGQPVTFGDQSNIIVWNAATKTEHFVRNAFFDTKAKDFGFIAATPTLPELSEANEHVYDLLASFEPHGIGCGAGAANNDAPASAEAGAVDVLQQVDVGKYQATSVKSDDPAAMSAYLKQNGYASRPDLDEWVRFYTAKKWIFTAFKVRKLENTEAQTGVIRMSFKTDEPFNPYYVPSGNSGPGGTLKIYFIAEGSYYATVGHSAKWNPAAWNAPLSENAANQLMDSLKLKPSDVPKNLMVTFFQRANWLEGAKEDLYFQRDSGYGNVVFGVLVVGAGFLWWFTRSRKARALQVNS